MVGLLFFRLDPLESQLASILLGGSLQIPHPPSPTRQDAGEGLIDFLDSGRTYWHTVECSGCTKELKDLPTFEYDKSVLH